MTLNSASTILRADSSAFGWTDLLVIGLIMLFCGLPYVVVIGFIAARKGQSVVLFCILCFIPIVNVVAGLWLASLTDVSVKDRLT